MNKYKNYDEIRKRMSPELRARQDKKIEEFIKEIEKGKPIPTIESLREDMQHLYEYWAYREIKGIATQITIVEACEEIAKLLDTYDLIKKEK